MRSSLEGRIAGMGVTYAFKEDEETYKDLKIKGYEVRFPQHNENLNGECVSWTMSKEEMNTYFARK